MLFSWLLIMGLLSGIGHLVFGELKDYAEIWLMMMCFMVSGFVAMFGGGYLGLYVAYQLGFRHGDLPHL